MIPSPNLDDRTYNDIVQEAIRLIPHYCPEWTNHNPTDPGITLIELFAWMTEMIIYRLNKVPEKTYLTLLDLVGLSFAPPQSAKSLLTFYPVEGYDGTVRIKRGTQASTSKSETAGSVVFETEKELVIKNIHLKACFSTKEGLITDNIKAMESDPLKKGFLLFSGAQEIERYLYVSDPVLVFLADNNILSLSFNAANEINTLDDEIVNFLEWQYWDGKKWIPVEVHRSLPGVMRTDNEIYFTGPIEIAETEVENITGFFLRASLVNYPEKQQCFEINEILVNLRFHGEGLNPDLCICNTENMVFHPIDMNKDFKVFVDIPKYNDAFYIASDEVFSKESSEIQINFYLTDDEAVDKPEPNETLLLKYEYWNGKNWLTLGNTTAAGVERPAGEYNFTDSTNAYTRSGIVRFKRPDNMKKCEINGQEFYWIRVRIGAGDFGKGGQHQQTEDGKWVWIYDKPVKPPVLNRIRLLFISARKAPENIKVLDNFHFTDHSEVNKKNFLITGENSKDKRYINLFEIKKEECAITFLGFDSQFPGGEVGIYFKLNEKKGTARQSLPAFFDLPGVRTRQIKRTLTIKWEYWNGTVWKNISVNDYTDNFHESGFIEFKQPEDMQQKNEFGQDLFWIRLIFEAGSFEVPPRVNNILLNSVYGHNHQTFENEILGSSTGAPSQSFEIFRKPVLPGIKLMVKEPSIPPAKERELILEEEGADAIVESINSSEEKEIWIQYHEVENFYASKPISRHFCVDYINNKVLFGDGTNGMIPPKLRNNVKIVKYMTGGGVAGNVGSGTINILRQNIPYVARVMNHYPAEGGSDIETIENLKNRASNVFKNLNRAVTIEDYQFLAMEASTSVARAKCLSKCGSEGEVIVVLVPRPDSDNFDLKEKLYPSSELLRRVKEFLSVRKLVGTKLRVEPPLYKNISINLKVVFKKEVLEIQALKEQIEYYIRRMLHPITGGLNGTGWEFGMPLAKNEIFNILEKVEGIYYIEEIELYDNDINNPVEKIMMEEDSLIFLDKVSITDRKYKY